MKPKQEKKVAASEGGPNFEQSLKRLEEIVESLERGNVPLNDVMKMYEEGVQISKFCLGQLSQAEIVLKRLSKDAQGNFELFDGKD
ncbi:MAG TPA: exodeoxyribonuclease VII small subunit [Bacteroidota bacterium]|nr:exodeoxyribonuclease VII small subunit [Bacteroidota bacterium]